jgi:hypothetical protein
MYNNEYSLMDLKQKMTLDTFKMNAEQRVMLNIDPLLMLLIICTRCPTHIPHLVHPSKPTSHGFAIPPRKERK